MKVQAKDLADFVSEQEKKIKDKIRKDMPKPQSKIFELIALELMLDNTLDTINFISNNGGQK